MLLTLSLLPLLFTTATKIEGPYSLLHIILDIIYLETVKEMVF